MLPVIIENKEVIIISLLSILLSISELLALHPKIKANSLFQLVWSGLKKVKELLKK